MRNIGIRSLAGMMILLTACAVLSLGASNVFAVGEEREMKSSNPLAGNETAISEGKTLYRARCGLCHGMRANGRGRGLPNSADLRKFKRGYSKFVEAVKNGWKTMPAWGGMGALTDEQINQIGAYLETLAISGAKWDDPKQGRLDFRHPAPTAPTPSLLARLQRVLLDLMIRPVHAAGAGYQQNLDHINSAWPETPGGVGLLTILEQEAGIARQHAGLAVENLEDLENIQLHTRHVRHAIDPSKESSGHGPGKGYGVCLASKGVSQHMMLARDAADATDSVKSHAEYVLASTANISSWCGKILDKAAQITGGASPVASAFFAEEIVEHTTWILDGRDANNDGKISSEDGEGGVAQIKQQLALME